MSIKSKINIFFILNIVIVFTIILFMNIFYNNIFKKNYEERLITIAENLKLNYSFIEHEKFKIINKIINDEKYLNFIKNTNENQESVLKLIDYLISDCENIKNIRIEDKKGIEIIDYYKYKNGKKINEDYFFKEKIEYLNYNFVIFIDMKNLQEIKKSFNSKVFILKDKLLYNCDSGKILLEKDMEKEFYEKLISAKEEFIKYKNKNAAISYINNGRVKFIYMEEKSYLDLLKNKYIYIILISFLLIFLFYMLLIFYVNNKILKPVSELKNNMKYLAQGDISKMQNIYLKKKSGEIEEFIMYYNKFIDDLKEIIKQIKYGANAILESSKEINMANQNIAEKASLQASSLEETTNSMEKISKIVASNTNETDMANNLTVKTKNNTERAGVVSNGLKNSILSITESSKRIESIIDVINDIAFQTNLLALNAAVEAARAGEQGKGFAVVASEVRNLSQKTSQAAKQIKTHIRESVQRVEEGNILVDTAISNLNQIVKEVKMVSEAINKIAISAKEQQYSIENVNKSIFELDEITQTNAAISQQTSASTNLLFKQATDFLKILSFFKTEENETGLREKKEYY